MTNRITKKTLHARIDMLNDMFNQPRDAWTLDKNGKPASNSNVFVLDCAYGGYRLSRICNTGGGERDITPRGTARETYDAINAFMAGVEAAQEAAQ